MDRYTDKFEYLVDNGYDRQILDKYFYVDDEVINSVVNEIFNDFVNDCMPISKPNCLIVGGQPGCGKSCYCNNFLESNSNYIYVNLDNYRVFHPYYDEIRKMIINKWGDADGISEKSPSNDLANITHYFVVRVNDLLVEKLSKSGYNILLEWNLRYPEGPLELVDNLFSLGYVNDIIVVLTSRNTSFEACNFRYDVIKKFDRLARRVPKSFHDLCTDNLAYSVGEIERVGMFDKNIINSIRCVLREGTVVWKNGDSDSISFVIDKYLNNNIDGINNDIGYVKKMYERESMKKKLVN